MTTIDLSQRYFTLPPREYYVSGQIFAEEFDKVFSRQWIYVGHKSQFPQRGSFMTLDFAGEKLLIVRGEENQFYGYFNVCRHRGYPVCEAETGTARAFVCPYHMWRYELHGSLKSVPKLRDGEFFDYQDYRLEKINVATWHGMIFFHIGADPALLSTVLSGFDSDVAYFEIEGTHLAHEVKLDLEANWKVSAENFNECYHCPGSHPTFCRVVDVPRMQNEAQSWFNPDDAVNAFIGGNTGMPLTGGWQTLSADGNLISGKLLGACTSEDAAVGLNVGINLLPNYFYAGFYVDHWWAQSIFPISPSRSRMVFRWYVREDAVEDRDYILEDLLRVTQTTYLEDIALIEKTYQGVMSRKYSPGPIVAKNEPLMYSYVSTYWSMMGASKRSNSKW